MILNRHSYSVQCPHCDIVVRLRGLKPGETPDTAALWIKEAANEIERLRSGPSDGVSVPLATLKKWHERLAAHRSSNTSDEAPWNNYGVIEVDDEIEALRTATLHSKTEG